MSTFGRFEGNYARAEAAARAAAAARVDAQTVAQLRHDELNAGAQEFVERMRAAGFPGGIILQRRGIFRPEIKSWSRGVNALSRVGCDSNGRWGVSMKTCDNPWESPTVWSGGDTNQVRHEVLTDKAWGELRESFLSHLAYIMEENGVSLQ
jgi:hypothetical protein